MPRIRSIHPGLFTDEAFVSVSDAARVLLLTLGCFSDHNDLVDLPINDPAIARFVHLPERISELVAAGVFGGGINDHRIVGRINFLFGHSRRVPSGWERTRLAVFDRDGYRCVYCGAHNIDFHADHVIPVSRGGQSELDNLVTACRFCNLSKGNRAAPRKLTA